MSYLHMVLLFSLSHLLKSHYLVQVAFHGYEQPYQISQNPRDVGEPNQFHLNLTQ